MSELVHVFLEKHTSPGVNLVKKLQVYFYTSRTLLLTSSHTFEFNKSLSTFLLQASNLRLQWLFYGIQFFTNETLYICTLQLQ